ncbi:hypothetical protein L1887_15431 [Cichorium endivia]|nr:hypothetical protein L1887_15431 [Cichorium endivia]
MAYRREHQYSPSFLLKTEHILSRDINDRVLGVELYSLINDLELYTVLEAISRYQNCRERDLERMRKMQEEASSSSGHGRNEGEETSTNVENPRRKGEDNECEEVRSMNKAHEFVKNFKNLEINPNGDDEPETVGTNEEDESTENVENREESTMEDYWNPQRLYQFFIELESIVSILYLFWKQLEAIMESEVEKSRVRDIVSGYRAAYNSRFEKLKKMREESSGSSSNGRNEEQESTEMLRITKNKKLLKMAKILKKTQKIWCEDGGKRGNNERQDNQEAKNETK